MTTAWLLTTLPLLRRSGFSSPTRRAMCILCVSPPLPQRFLPDTDALASVEQPINQTMHFTRSETFPPEGPASVTTTQTVSTTKPARPQPEGLRARYTPLGVPSPKPTITAPISAKSKAVAKVAEQTAAASSPSKKKRKHRDDGEDGPTTATVSTPVQKNSGATGKKNTPAENSIKKQKTDNEAPRKVTPIPPPRPGPSGGSQPNSALSASSQPAPRSRRSMSPGVGLPATQVPSSKQTPVPIPRLPSHPSVDRSSGAEETAKERKKAEKKAEKERKKAEKEATKATSHTAAKVTQVAPPRFDARGRPLP